MAKKSPFIFVLMPFKQDFDDIYQLGIKAACIEAGGHCDRVDEQIFVESILERIYDQIEKADLVVADMSGQNINVFYETGFAHALGKQVILVTQNAHDIPFDLQHYPHIIYGNRIRDLKTQLCHKVKWLFSHPSQGRSARDTRLLSEYKTKLEVEKTKLTKKTEQLTALRTELKNGESQIASLRLQLSRAHTTPESASQTSPSSRKNVVHKIRGGICQVCGCSAGAIEYFKWTKCQGRPNI